MGFDCDVIVVGGGPAGSTAAAALARAGRRVILFERDAFPRFHIGESLLASVNEVVTAIGADAAVQAAAFPRKWGATFMTPDGGIERFADFAVSREVPHPQTWQVPRAAFDALLLDHAGACGAAVHQQHRVLDAAFDSLGVTVTVRDISRADDNAATAPCRSLRARAIVDASGRGALLGRALDLRVDEPRLANVALFAHYAGVPRADGRRAGDIRVVARRDRGWFWLIPISDELMSVGVVLPRPEFQAQPRVDPAALLEALVADTPAVARLMAAAERRWPVRVERDFSFAARRYAGDRWVVVGDAGSFLDPVFSSGVAIAMESGLEAARAMDAGLSRGDLSARAFRTFNRRQRRRYAAFRRFVLAFYTRGFRDLFFSPDPPRWMFESIVTVLAGYWRPSMRARLWLVLFFVSVWLQERLRFAPSYLDAQPKPAPGRSGCVDV